LTVAETKGGERAETEAVDSSRRCQRCCMVATTGTVAVMVVPLHTSTHPVCGVCLGNEMESSATREYPSLIQTFFMTHTVGGVFLRDEDPALYEEMLRLQGLGSNTPSGVPYTEDEIMAIVRRGKQQGHIPSVGRVVPGHGTDVLSPPQPPCTHSSDVVELQKSNKLLTKQFGSASKSDGCGDDEPGDDEDGGEDEEDDEDADS
ncbi:hypothetical protein Tco_1048486, partial [Tanacetum coccineum]